MRALITGISGFVGSHLAEYLSALGADIYGIALNNCAPANTGVSCRGNILDGYFLRGLIAKVRPTHVFHCAGQLAGKTQPHELFNVNVIGMYNVLAAVKNTRPRVIVAASSAVYGRRAAVPISEDSPFNPMSEYSASKAAQELVAISQFHAHAIPVIRARIFNLLGPRQPEIFMASSLAKQIVAVERGAASTVRVHHLERRRDYVDVRDAVRACAILAECGEPGEAYNVCSGTSRSVRETLAGLMSQTQATVTVEVDDFSDASAAEDHRGSFVKLHGQTGWEPKISFEESLRDILNDWREKAIVVPKGRGN